MSEPVTTMTVGDRGPAFSQQLLEADGVTPYDLTGAQSLTFRMAIQDGVSPVISGLAAVLGVPTQGFFSYSWGASDTAVPGLYMAELDVVDAAGKARTFPPRPWPILIRPQV